MAERDTPADRFALSDLLFSRTDDRGVIQAGNAVFQRVSVYEWDKMIKAPHRILRHPDMPRAVFQLMWSAIKAGQPIGAYVQNMAEDGVPYWVFATILPLEDGYISLRLKPSCGMLEKVDAIYRSIRKTEDESDIRPEDSAKAMEREICALGFSNYSEFMCQALFQESASRDKGMGRQDNKVLGALADMYSHIRKMEGQASSVEGSFRQTNQIPYNMRLQAGRLEGSDGPISVISGNYRIMTQGLAEDLARFTDDSAVGADTALIALFKTAAAELISEMAQIFKREEVPVQIDQAGELRMLAALTEQYTQDAVHSVSDLAIKVRKFGGHCRDMRRMLSALELTRIMCKIERSKFPGERAGLDEIVNRLADAQSSLQSSFDEILDSVKLILTRSDYIEQATDTRRASLVA